MFENQYNFSSQEDEVIERIKSSVEDPLGLGTILLSMLLFYRLLL